QKQTRVTVRVSRQFNTTAERVFDAWLDPQRARQFLFTRSGQVVVHAEIDAQVGGSFLFVARRDGKDIDHIGKYLEIDRPRRLVFTLCVPSVWSDDNRIAVDIVPLETGCELTITHEGVLPEQESRIEGGWTLFLEGLGKLNRRSDFDSPQLHELKEAI
ncbi:MAG TPA: SRPBCC domain-containing protein, partial [Bryobacteraceae bacterium]|nr:SRPBCC domain-containing protein [Bryobacteraceae bacterium]